MKLKLFLFLLLVITFSCSQNDDEPPIPEDELGAIFVTVKQADEFISNVTITTVPITQTVNTNSSGSILINDVPVETYQILATHPLGTGEASVVVTNGSSTDVIIELISDTSDPPTVLLETYDNQNEYFFGENIFFRVVVSDDMDALEDLVLKWDSNVDGVFSDKSVNGFGHASVPKSDLSIGDHIITVTVKDIHDNEATAEIPISILPFPLPVILDPISTGINIVPLNWSLSNEVTFDSYKIYRAENGDGNFEQLNFINDINTLSYIDEDITVGRQYDYKIAVVDENGSEAFSNIEGIIFYGNHIDLGTRISRLMVDQTRPYIYALDPENNTLLFLNKETKLLEKAVTVGPNPTDFDIDEDGERLYVANFGSNQISVVNLNSQEVESNLTVEVQSNSKNPYRIACLANNKLVWAGNDAWYGFRFVDITSGTLLHTEVISSYLEFATSLDKSILYVGSSGGGSSDGLIEYELSGNTLTEVDRNDTDLIAGERSFFISGDGEILFSRGNKISANNINFILGNFSDPTFTTNFDGSLGIGNLHIFNGENFAIQESLPLTNGSSSYVMGVDYSTNKLYIYTSNVKKLLIYDLP